MSKQDLINTLSKNRDKWPYEALVLEQLYLLSNYIKNTSVIDNYLDNKVSLEDTLTIFKNDELINQYCLKLKKYCYQMKQLREDNNPITYNSIYLQRLINIGTLLAHGSINKDSINTCEWWNRYITITETMGVECVLSIRTAVSLFKRDPLSDELQNKLIELFKED